MKTILKNTKTPRLVLNKETLRRLNDEQLRNAGGGFNDPRPRTLEPECPTSMLCAPGEDA